MARGAILTLPAGSVGIDYSFSRPDLQQAWNLGYRFVSRYLADRSVRAAVPKIITPAERDQLADVGFGIMLNWEQNISDALTKGYDGGVRAGALAGQQVNELEGPTDTPVVFSVDTDVSQGNWPALDAYATGFRDGYASPLYIRPVGSYVESDYIDHLVEDLDFHGPMWWPAASSWSHGRVTPNAHVKQLVGYVLNNTSDANVTLRPCPFWFPNASAPPPPPDPDPLHIDTVSGVRDVPALFASHDALHWPGSSTLPMGDYPPDSGIIFTIMPDGSVRHVTAEEWNTYAQLQYPVAMIPGAYMKGLLDSFGVYHASTGSTGPAAPRHFAGGVDLNQRTVDLRAVD